MSSKRSRSDRPFGVREWMGGGWWLALAFSLVVILTVRSGPVGAPAQASDRSLDSFSSVSKRFRPSLSQERSQERSVEFELDRPAFLQEDYDDLDGPFSQVTDLVFSKPPAELPPEIELIPTPVEAIFVLPDAPNQTPAPNPSAPQ